jgi:RNA polymerase sigma factor (sigma-70 family)
VGPLKCRRAPQATAEEAERRPGLLHCRVEVTGVEAQAGDQQSFMEQVAHMLPLAQRLAYGMLQNAHECEDALQDASFKAWRAFPRLREGSDLRAWFLTIVAKECRQRRRSRWWSTLKVESPPARVSGGHAPGLGDDAAIELRRALNRIPNDMKMALVLRYYLDFSFEDIGRVMGVSAAAAKSRTHRALSRLRVEVPEVLADA